MLPEVYYRYTFSFLRFVRRVSILTEEGIRLRNLHPPLILPPNRYRIAMIINLDETPIPFQFAADMTYDVEGKKTISTQAEKSGWDKRQATVLLSVKADASKYLVPLPIFRGEPGVSIFKREKNQYRSSTLMRRRGTTETSFYNG
jgi:hypothetical protein